MFAAGGTGGTWEQPAFWTSEAARDEQELDCHFDGYTSGAYKANGVVFTCIQVRQQVFSEVRFQYQRLGGPTRGELWGDQTLSLLEKPWPNGTTGELLARMEQDYSLAGNFFAVEVNDRDGRRVRRLRPDWVTIVTGSRSGKGPYALDARVVGYMYQPKGVANPPDPVLLTPDQVVHWSPTPDPTAQWRGMSWLTPIVNEIKGDQAATQHKLKYFEHGTVGGLAITYDPSVSLDNVKRFAEMFRQQHAGVENAYKTYHLGGGAGATTLGADLKQLDFKITQGAGETRIAAASGVGAVMAQFSEGLAGSALNSGNFSAARRRLADITMRPQWRSAAAALQTFAPPPSGSRLWYDASDVSFLQEDEKDEADIQTANAGTIRSLLDAGFDPDAVVKAVTAGDLRTLVGQHSGLFSVQLQAAGADGSETEGGATDEARALAEMIQKLYLGVGPVISSAEARSILNRAGAGLTGPPPTPEG